MAGKKKSAKQPVAKAGKGEAGTKHFMLFEVSSKEPIKLNMKVIEYIPGKKAKEHRVLVSKKIVKGKKAKSQDDQIVSEIFDDAY